MKQLSGLMIFFALQVWSVKSFSYHSFGSFVEGDVLAQHSETDDDTSPFHVKKGYTCDYCLCGFNRRKSLLEHEAGKRHKAVIAEGEIAWQDFITSGTKTYQAKDGSLSPSPFFDQSVTKMEVARAWSFDHFMEGLRARSKSSKKKAVAKSMVGVASRDSSLGLLSAGNNANAGGGNQIDPRLRLCDLPPAKRAALFRFLHATTTEIEGLIDMISALPDRYVRVKEVLESVEVYYHIVDTIFRTKQRNAKRVTRVYDIGCGHGLVGMLIAARYPTVKVHSIDLVPRDSYVEQRSAFESSEISMENLSFETGDLTAIKELEEGSTDDHGHTLMLCVHGCKELTHESIEVARDHGWAWLAVPCCLQKSDHLNDTTSLKIQSDHTRYALLCGAIASKYQAESISTIDSRITGRGIVLASRGESQ